MEKKVHRRRTDAQLDTDAMRELEELVKQHGFGNINLTTLIANANMEPKVFYRRYESMAALYDKLAKQYDFWMNETVAISELNTLGPRTFFAKTLKTLYSELYRNPIMQKLLLWEMAEDNSTTRRTAQMRDTMNLNLIKYYELMFKPIGIDIKCIIAILISGIYYLILHRERAELCTINFNGPEGEKAFNEAVDILTDMIFDRLDHYNYKKECAIRMLSDGMTHKKICNYLDITDTDLKIFMQQTTA